MKRYILLIFFSLFFYACSKSEKANILLNKENISISSSGESIEMIVSSNIDWNSNQVGNYNFNMNPSAGKAGDTKVVISSDKNNTSINRNSTITINGHGASVSILVSQPYLKFEVEPKVLEMSNLIDSKSLSIISNTRWTIDNSNLPDWIKSISPLTGENNGLVNIEVNKSINRKDKNSFTLRIKYGESFSSILITQDIALNNPPTKPTNLNTNYSLRNVSIVPKFLWDNSEDADGDVINYTVSISKDGNNWNNIYAGNKTESWISATLGSLSPNQAYYYKVIANDGYNNGKVESDIVQFITGDKDAYYDGEYITYQQSNKLNPVIFIFTGDGFTPNNFKFDDKFDKNLDRAIEGIFSIEPYKTYREYFTVYKLAAYSSENGISNKFENINKNTIFSCVMEGGNSTGINCNSDKVFEYVYKIDNLNANNIINTSIGVIINEDVYAGTCISWTDGRNISMIPVPNNSASQQTKFENVVCHEMGGHGFGKLADEYRYYEEAIPIVMKNSLIFWQNNGYHLNVSLSPQREELPWKDIIGKNGYSHVGTYLGGYLYKQGVWRSEFVSCMEDNRMYFNTQSRWLIAKRIFDIAKENLDWDLFVSKDVNKVDNNIITKSVSPNFRPLGKQIMIRD